MKRMGSIGAMALGMVFALAGMAWADDVPGVDATGVDADGLVVAPGTADLHWDIVQSDDARIATPTAAIAASPHRAHFDNDAPGTIGSSWVAASSSTASAVSGGDHHFQAEVDLTGFDPSTAVLSGRFASDNEIVDVFVNGVSQGIAGSSFSSWTDFTLDTDFQDGTNTVTFVVNNQGDGAMGFRLEWSGTADLLPVVEPEPEPDPSIEAELVARLGKRAHPFFRFGWCSMSVAVVSTSEFHSAQPVHRPAHLEEVAPQPVHTNITRSAMG